MTARGFTLVELLVALCIASIAIAGGITTLSQVYESWHITQQQARLQERALYVLATLEPEIQMAGFFGSDSSAMPAWAQDNPPPDSLLSCGAALPHLTSGIETFNNAWPFNCAAQTGGAVAASDVLVIRRAAVDTSAPEAGRAQLLDSEAVPALRQLRWDGHAPNTAPADVLWRDLLLRAYYIARQSDGDASTPALRVKSLTTVSGRPTYVDTEVMSGVARMFIELLPDSAHPSSARLTLSVQTDAADARHGQIAQLTVTREFALRNAPPR
jgi:prepilin-type N-terminal cleavage/methylation domain-containing protein